MYWYTKMTFVRLVSFEYLGHKPIPGGWPYGLTSKETACSVCKCFDGSETGNYPCGDPLGHTLRCETSIREGRHAWDFYTRDNRLVGYCFLER